MYESFFGFTQRPFLALPRTDRYYPGEAIEAARQNLTRCIDRAEGCGLIVGPAGSGKTLLCQVLAEHFHDRLAPVLLSNVKLTTRKELLQAILFEMGMPYRRMQEGELRLSLIDRLTPNEACSEGMLLLVDEAHSLSPRLFEELRMLTNLVRGGSQRVRLVMAGGAVLEERFAHPRMESFNQRLVARCYLESFSAAESIEYVRAQTAAAGADADQVWQESALRAVHQATDGCPRLINQVCDHALVLAATAQTNAITSQTIEEAWADLQQLPMPWNGDPPATAVTDSDGDPSSQSTVIEFGSLDETDEDPPGDETHVASGGVDESAGDTAMPEPEMVGSADSIGGAGEMLDGETAGDLQEAGTGHHQQEVADFQPDVLPQPETQLDHIEFHLADAQKSFDDGDESMHVELVFNDVPPADEPQEQVVIDDFDGLSCDYAVNLSPEAKPIVGEDSDVQDPHVADHSSDVPQADWQPAPHLDAGHADDTAAPFETEAVEGEPDSEYDESDASFEIGSLPSGFEMAHYDDLQSGHFDDAANLTWRHLSPEGAASFTDEAPSRADDPEDAPDQSISEHEETRDEDLAERRLTEVDQDDPELEVAADADTRPADLEPAVPQHPTIPVRHREYRRLFAMLYDGDRDAGQSASGITTGEQ